MSLIYIRSDTILDNQCFDNIPLTVKVGIKLDYQKNNKDLNEISAKEIKERSDKFWENYPFKQTHCSICMKDKI